MGGHVVAIAVCAGIAAACTFLSICSLCMSLIALRRSKVEYRVISPEQKSMESFEKELAKISNPGNEDFKEDWKNVGVDPDDLV